MLPTPASPDGSSSPAAPTDGADLLKLDQQLCFALYAMSLAMTKAYKPMLEPLGLTYPQYLVMLLLWESDERTVNELGQLLHLDSGTLTPLLKRMESAGLLNRRRDPQDERRVRVSLTPQGQALKQEALSVPTDLACRLQLDGPAIAQLRTQLTDLRARLDGPGPAK